MSQPEIEASEPEKTEAGQGEAEEPKAEEAGVEESKAEEPEAGESEAGESEAEESEAEESEAEESEAEEPEAEESEAEEPEAEESEADTGETPEPNAGEVATEPDENAPPAPDESEDSKWVWFAVHTYSSYENKVKQAIEHRSTLEGMRENIKQVIIPTEMVVEIKGGKKRTTPRTLMPGYVLVQMEPTEECFNLVKSVKGVSSFVGDGHAAVPLTEAEVKNLLDIMEEKHEKPKPKMMYHKGDQIKVTEGPFANFVGYVEMADEEKGKLTVMVSIFGRPTPVELDVLQVEPT